MRRRSFLGLLGALPLAGCTSAFGGESGRANHHVWVTNAHEESRDVTVRFTRDGEPLVDETRSVGPGAEWDLGRFTEPGSYVLTVRAVGEERRESYDLPMESDPHASYAEGDVTAEGALRLMIYRTTG